MNKENLKKSVKQNIDFVKDYYEKSDEQGFSSMFIVETMKDGKPTNIVAIPANAGAMEHRDKMVFHLGVRSQIEKMKGVIDSIEAIFMMSEAWFSVANKNDKDLAKMRKPSEDPNKKEAIISAGLAQTGDSYLEMFELKRSFNHTTSKLQVEFAALKEVGDEDMKAESPLLKRFWGGVKLMEELEADMPDYIKNLSKEMTSDEIFEIMVRKMGEAEELYEKFTKK